MVDGDKHRAGIFSSRSNRTHHENKPMLADTARIDIVCGADEGLAGELKSGFQGGGHLLPAG